MSAVYNIDMDQYIEPNIEARKDAIFTMDDEERDAYEAGYHTGFGAGGGWDK